MHTPGDEDERVESLGDRSPGQDDEDPYEDVAIDTLPAWWQRAIEEHRRYDLRPYRPPRFQDGELYPEVRNDLEETVGDEVRLACFDVGNNVWTILVGGEEVGETERWRSPEGYSVIEMASDRFREVVVDAA